MANKNCSYWADGGFCDFDGDCIHQSGCVWGNPVCGDWAAGKPSQPNIAKSPRRNDKPQPTKTARVEIRVTPADKAKLAEIKRLYGLNPADLLADGMAMVDT